jgi:hypothetical protein
VKDPGEAAIAGAEISVAASDTQVATKVLQTDKSGTASLNLPMGTYDLFVEMQAFTPLTKRIVFANTDSQKNQHRVAGRWLSARMPRRGTDPRS